MLISSSGGLSYYLSFYASLPILCFLLYSIITQSFFSLSSYVSSVSMYFLASCTFFEGERCLRPNISVDVRFSIEFGIALAVAFKKRFSMF